MNKIIQKNSLFIFFAILFLNVWIWKIFSHNFLIFIFAILTSFFVYKIINDQIKNCKKGFIFCFFILFAFQIFTTDRTSLYELDNNQQYVQQLKLQQYPPVYIDILGTRFWIPIAHWFEGRKESIAVARITKNLFENLDFNLYFFANHPRGRVGVNEFEKFPYILFPFFVIGILSMSQKANKTMGVSILLSLFLLGIIGNRNPIGTFLFFPFFVAVITKGVESLKNFSNKYIVLAIIIYLIVLIQTVSYAIY